MGNQTKEQLQAKAFKKATKSLNLSIPPDRAVYMDKLMENIEEGVINLIYRWDDEKKYENIKEYGKAIEGWLQILEPEIKVVSITKKFLIQLSIPGFPYKPYIKYSKTTVSWSSQPIK